MAKHELVETFLNLEEIDLNLFRSTHLVPGRKEGTRVYGGQVMGQALMAASKTVPEKFNPHSFHCYFIYAADKNKPLVYQVDRVRDSRSFCTRFVKAIQNGKAIFAAEFSFQVLEPDSISHQTPMPDVPPPEECEDAADFLQRSLDMPGTISEEGRKALEAYSQILDFPSTFDVKLITPRAYIQVPVDRPMKFACWVKSSSPIGGDDNYLHHCVAAFISDIAPIGTPIAAHAGAGFRLGMAASLDHTMWIHRHDFRIDDWVLYETESPIAAASRALIHGKMWTRDGRMVLSSAQEILVRGYKEEKEKSSKMSQKKRHSVF